MLASDLRDGETIFKNVCASCHVRGGLVITTGSNLESISNIANEGIGYMKGYKNKLREGEHKILAKWIIQKSKKGWKK